MRMEKLALGLMITSLIFLVMFVAVLYAQDFLNTGRDNAKRFFPKFRRIHRKNHSHHEDLLKAA